MLLGQRFWIKVRIGRRRECWRWLASRSRDGYGRFAIDRSATTAQRVAWSLARGPIPSGQHVLHRCDNRLCVNPWHMFLGTNDDNVADRVRKGRSADSAGVKNGRALLTDRKVAQIRRLYAGGRASQRTLAVAFRVSAGTVYYVVHRKHWRHVDA